VTESDLHPDIRCMLAPPDLDLRAIAATAVESDPRCRTECGQVPSIRRAVSIRQVPRESTPHGAAPIIRSHNRDRRIVFGSTSARWPSSSLTPAGRDERVIPQAICAVSRQFAVTPCKTCA